MTKTALITGISGQDGYYLTKLLLNKNYKVYGTIRRKSVVEENCSRLEEFKHNTNLILEYCDILDRCSIDRIVKLSKPNETYHLAAQSQVAISFTLPEFTIKTNALGSFNVIDSVKENCKNTRLYLAGSSEMFGNSIDKDGFQRETTPMNPISPYSVAKLFMYNLGNHYRNAYNMFICNGICFNHESMMRGTNFVTQKIVDGAIKIKLQQQQYIELGNLQSRRDWSHAQDMVQGMWLMLQQNKPDNYVLASGETRSVDDFCKITFEFLNIPNYKKYIKINPKYIRPHELNVLKGDASKAKKTLKWRPEYLFEELVEDMIINHPLYKNIK